MKRDHLSYKITFVIVEEGGVLQVGDCCNIIMNYGIALFGMKHNCDVKM